MFNFTQETPTTEMSKSIYIKFTDLLKELRNSYVDTFLRITNPGEEPLSNDERIMLSNPDDRKKYLEALEELKREREKGEVSPKVTIKLSNGEEITLTTVS